MDNIIIVITIILIALSFVSFSIYGFYTKTGYIFNTFLLLMTILSLITAYLYMNNNKYRAVTLYGTLSIFYMVFAILSLYKIV